MGRRKADLTESAPYFELARWLRSLRERAGLTYREMADRAGRPGCSAVTLSRADSGSVLPKCAVVEVYAVVCGAAEHEARSRWEKTATSAGPRDRGEASVLSVPRRGRGRRLELVYEPAHLLEAMHRLRHDAGHPSLRELQDRATDSGFGPLPRSTLADVLSGLRLPSEALLISYALACGQPGHRIHAWRAAWGRVRRGDGGLRGVGVQGVVDRLAG
ncbi:helix-turn-helix domain-containing protein [Streptomyces geranii]|uniref:helix-turn-helix domain-containing protein n=1 Tax=Streptomyces geranii TaxID=2058923 RepID=UPI000D0263E8|nr:helix-turn-helix transcriptional regulator [Streptomyces geranii]